MINYVIFISLLILGSLFYFITNNVLDLQIESGVWWFYLLLFTLAFVILVFINVQDPKKRYKTFMYMFIIMGLLIALLVLFIIFKPYEPQHLENKLGLKPIFADPNLPKTTEVYSKQELGHAKEPAPEISWKRLAPEPLDQGFCGSCVFYGSAFVVNTRINIQKERNGEPIPQEKVVDESCVGQTSDLKWWYVSPQDLLNRTTDTCETGAFAFEAFRILMEDGSPDHVCLPTYSSLAECTNNCQQPAPPGSIPDFRTNGCYLSNSFKVDECSTTEPEFKRSGKLIDYLPFLGVEEMKTEITNNGPILCQVAFAPDGGVESQNSAVWTLQKEVKSWTLFGNYTASRLSQQHVSRPSTDPNYTDDLSHSAHVLAVTGYGVNSAGIPYWEVASSWGKEWGIGGYSKIEMGVNAWGIESHPCYAPRLD